MSTPSRTTAPPLQRRRGRERLIDGKLVIGIVLAR